MSGRNMNNPLDKLEDDYYDWKKQRNRRRNKLLWILGIGIISALIPIVAWRHSTMVRTACLTPAICEQITHPNASDHWAYYWAYWGVAATFGLTLAFILAVAGMLVAYATRWGPRFFIRGPMVDAERRKSFFFWLWSLSAAAVGLTVITCLEVSHGM